MLTAGTLLAGRYEIVGRIGAGGMSNVYKAKDQKLNRFVAVKVLKPEFSADATFVKNSWWKLNLPPDYPIRILSMSMMLVRKTGFIILLWNWFRESL